MSCNTLKMKKLRCIIADDEPLALRLIETYVQRTPALEPVGSYTSAKEALQAIGDGRVDLAFLDIQMPQMSGLELASVARDNNVGVIFITAYRDFALDGFRVNALNYLLKPVSYEEFSDAVARAVALLHDVDEPEPEAFMMVRSDYKFVRVDYDDILYVEGLKDYVKIFLKGRERPLLTQMSLKAVAQTLPDDRFVRVHRSFIVAVDKVESISRTHIVVGATDIPVGDTYRNQVFEKFKL